MLSLRARLTLIILLPVLAIASLAGIWQARQATRTAIDVFDRSLLSAALAVSYDISLSEGDALSQRTKNLLSDTSGGPVYYHVYAPDGVIVAGYATPPVGIPIIAEETAGPTYFSATYLGSPVSGVRLQTSTEIDGFSGVFTTTVWQETALRDAFVWQLTRRSIATICALIAVLGMTVWFGVRVGLRPLLDLQEAIGKRTSDELGSIKRPVPEEVRGVVNTLNRLFDQVSGSMAAQQEFISNAAHQLRNPIAGVLSLAESVRNAPNWEQAKTRSSDLLLAAQETSDLAQQLLALERAKSISPQYLQHEVETGLFLRTWFNNMSQTVPQHVSFCLQADTGLGTLKCEPAMLQEALTNLVDNALKHGGASLSKIDVTAKLQGGALILCVSDDGLGISGKEIETALRRFSQVSAQAGSGLGLPIVETIAKGHGGSLELICLSPGLAAKLQFPISADTENRASYPALRR